MQPIQLNKSVPQSHAMRTDVPTSVWFKGLKQGLKRLLTVSTGKSFPQWGNLWCIEDGVARYFLIFGCMDRVTASSSPGKEGNKRTQKSGKKSVWEEGLVVHK